MRNNGMIQFLEWDSCFFGVRIARIACQALSVENVASVTASCVEEKIDCAYYLANPADSASIRIAEENGFHLVDIRVTLDRQITPLPTEWCSDSPYVRRAKETDIPLLRQIAAKNHRDSRFYHDGKFPVERCDELYATWIEKSCRDYADTVLVADCGEGAAGYLSCHLRKDDVGQIGLVGVSETCQGKGLGRQLLDESLRWFASAGCRKVEVVTQGRNIAAQRLYQKGGFLTGSLQLWYHWWPQNPAFRS